ncbi:unnamed protein product [Lymnaea stagnalis]|uniref:RRM domain-containing protein n=1 Tax=Lymnaea stagnalis TaxID=6523 RepID=A0AAV2IFD6_LYMST
MNLNLSLVVDCNPCRCLATGNAGMASVFVGDLHSDVTESDIYNKFSQIGTVLSIKVCRDASTGKSLGYGYVVYQDPEDAERAVEMFNFDVIQNQSIRVVMADKASLQHSLQGNVFVKNLDRSVDSNLLHRAFSAYGNILSCKVPHGKKGSKCHGFVQFENEQAANAAIDGMNGTMFCGKKLYVGHFLNREQREPPAETPPSSGTSSSSLRTVYIKNLGHSVDSIFLKITCSPYGEVSNVKIIRDTDGSSKGFAFVTFKRVEEAVKAIEMLNGKEIDGRILFAGPAMKKSGRKSHLQHPSQGHEQHPLQGHEFKEIIIEDEPNFEIKNCQSHPEQKPHHQLNHHRQQQQQHTQIITVKSNMFPAMPSQKHQQSQQTANLFVQQLAFQNSPYSSMGAVQLPGIGSTLQDSLDGNTVVVLPQIHQGHVYLQPQQETCNTPVQISLDQQDSSSLAGYEQVQQQSGLPESQQVHTGNDSSTATTSQGVNLYVKHLDDDVDDAILKGMFSKFGEVISAKVMMEGEKSRGFGFVCFARAEDAARATRDMRRRVDDVNRKPLYVAPAQRKEERQAFFREKLKSRQNEIHTGDVDTSQKCITLLDGSKTHEPQTVPHHDEQMALNLPGGDSSNTTFTPNHLKQSEPTKLNEAPTHTGNSPAQQTDQTLSDNQSIHNNKFQSIFRSIEKRNNFYNFECFNVENLRTPLIKPTRLSNSTDDRSLSSHNRAETDTSRWFPFHVGGDSDHMSTSDSVLNSINAMLSPRLSDHSKRHGEILPKRSTSPWKTTECKDASNTYGKSNCISNSNEEHVRFLAPIGCKQSSQEKEPKMSGKSSVDKPRPNQNFNFRPRPNTRLAPHVSESKGDCNLLAPSQLDTQPRGEGVFYFSGSAQNIPSCYSTKKDFPTFEGLYDPQNAIPFSRSVLSENAIPPSRNFPSQNAVPFSHSTAFSDTEPYTVSESSMFHQKLKRVNASIDTLLPLEPLKNSRTRTASNPLETGSRRSMQALKRKSDTAFDLDHEDYGFGLSNHWGAKRRMVAPSLRNDQYSEVRPCSPTIDIPGQGVISLRTMSCWPVDQQKFILLEPLKTKLTDVLEGMLHESTVQEIWNQELSAMTQEDVRMKEMISSLTDRLVTMIMEMDVAEILNLLQSKDHLFYLVSQGLKQIEKFDNVGGANLSVNKKKEEMDTECHLPDQNIFETGCANDQ